MRICLIMSGPLPPREGIGFYVWNLARYLVRDGHQVQIITRGGAHSTTREERDGITIWRPPFLPTYPLHVHLHGVFVDQLVRRLEPEVDLFHLHSPLVQLPRTARPLMATIHTPMIADTQAIAATSALGLLVKLQAPISVSLERHLFQRVGRLAAVANSVAQELADYGIDPAEVAVLGNGVDTDQFFPERQPPDPAGPYVLTTGRLGARKGLEDLIACAALVAAELPELRFLIAGSGPLEASLRSEIARRGLTRTVVLLGHVDDRARLASLYRGASAYVHAAHYEGLPTALIEAMACARPAVATAVSGNLDVITQAQNGLLVPPRAPEQLAQAILRLVRDPELNERLGAAAHQTIMERYAWSVVGRAYVAEYEALLRGEYRCNSSAKQFA
jgi:glycosyltransferase involved in cell wall biosynthesis